MPEISAELVDRLAAIASSITAFLETMKQPDERISDDVMAKMKDRILRGLCLQGGELLAEQERVTRGLCGTCYNRMMQRIARGESTMAWYVANGMVLPERQKKKGGRKPKGPDPAGELLSEAAEVAKGYITEQKERQGQTRKKKKRRKAQ